MGRDPTNFEIVTRAEIKSQTLSRRSHQAPLFLTLLASQSLLQKDKPMWVPNLTFREFVYFYTCRILGRVLGGSWRLRNFSLCGGSLGDEAGLGVPEEDGGLNAEAVPGPLTITDVRP